MALKNVEVKRDGHAPYVSYDRAVGFWGTPHWERDMVFPKCSDTPFHITMNSKGCRDIEHSGNGGIMCVGGSHTWGSGVEQDSLYTAVLREFTDKNVYNMGQCSFGLDQVFLLIKDRFDEYRPDTVVVEQYPWGLHRVVNNTLGEFIRPSFHLDKDGKLALRKIPSYANWKPARKLLIAYYNYKKALTEFSAGIRLKPRAGTYVDPFFLLWKIGYYAPMYELVDNILAAMSEFCREKGIHLLFAVTAVKEQYDRSDSALVDYTLPRKKLINLLEKNDIDWTDVARDLVDGHTEIDPCRFPDGHINVKGHRVFGESVARALEERGRL